MESQYIVISVKFTSEVVFTQLNSVSLILIEFIFTDVLSPRMGFRFSSLTLIKSTKYFPPLHSLLTSTFPVPTGITVDKFHILSFFMLFSMWYFSISNRDLLMHQYQSEI